MASPLVSVDQLRASLTDPDLVIVDLRWYLGRPGAGREAYLEGHIPGAIHLDLDDDLSDPDGFGSPGRHPLPSPAVVAERLGRVGIGDRSRVVGYDDVGGWVAARLWWMLDDLGFGRTNGGEGVDRGAGFGALGVLDGGIGAWTAAGHPLETGERRLAPQVLHLADRWTHVIDRDTLRSRLGTVTLLDARAPARYRGEIEPIDPVAGHIPTAVSAPTEGNLAADGRFLPPEELRERFARLAQEADGGLEVAADGGAGAADADASDGAAAREVVTSCGSGTSACHHVLAARHAGLPDPILYVGSYSDWSRSGYPVATGPEPGSPALARRSEVDR